MAVITFDLNPIIKFKTLFLLFEIEIFLTKIRIEVLDTSNQIVFEWKYMYIKKRSDKIYFIINNSN